MKQINITGVVKIALCAAAVSTSPACGLSGSDVKRQPGNSGKVATSTVEGTAAVCAGYDAEKRASIPACSEIANENLEPVVIVSGRGKDQEIQAIGNTALISLNVKPPAGSTVNEIYAQAADQSAIPLQFAKVDFGSVLFCLFLPPSLPTGQYTVNLVAQGSQSGTAGGQAFNYAGQYASVTISYKSEFSDSKATLKSACPSTQERSFIQQAQEGATSASQ